MLHEWPGAPAILSNTAAVMVDVVLGAKHDKFETDLAAYEKQRRYSYPTSSDRVDVQGDIQ